MHPKVECILFVLFKSFLNDQAAPNDWAARREGVLMVSPERIYPFFRQDKKNGGTLYKHLRHRLKHRKRPVRGKGGDTR
jgi:IS30 family transposase